MELSDEPNRLGLAAHHKRRMCYPYTDVPAFTFWPAPTADTDMDEWQDSRCAMCGHCQPLVRDHDHDTGLVRGLLCSGCNTREGMGDPKIDRWRNGETVAALTGTDEVYWSPWGREAIRARSTDAELRSAMEMMARTLLP